MKDKDVVFIDNGGALTFNAGNGFAINPIAGAATQNAFAASDFRDILITAVGTGTVIVYGSTQKTPPDFSAASSITNSYVAITLADYSIANTYYNGASGVAVTGSTKIVELNTNLLTWVAFHRSVDTVDVLLTITNAQ